MKASIVLNADDETLVVSIRIVRTHLDKWMKTCDMAGRAFGKDFSKKSYTMGVLIKNRLPLTCVTCNW